MSKPVADEFEFIRDRVKQLREQRALTDKRCKNGCGAALHGVHQPGCTCSWRVTASECDG